MSDEIYNLISRNIALKCSKEEMRDILEIAESLGYYDGHYSNEPQALIAFVDGFLSAAIPLP